MSEAVHEQVKIHTWICCLYLMISRVSGKGKKQLDEFRPREEVGFDVIYHRQTC